MSKRDKREARRTNAKDWAEKQGKGFDNPAIKLPQGVEYYKLEQGVHKVDFMPYRVGVGNPAADEGFEHFERQYSCHRLPTPDGKSLPYVCLWEAFKKPCPFCAWLNKHGQTASKEQVGALKARLRHLWIVNDKPGDENNPLKVLDTNDWNKGQGFRELMQDAIKSAGENGANFANLEDGLSVQLIVKEQPAFPGGKPYNAVTRIDLVPRKHSYSEEMLDKAPCLDECIQDYDAGAIAKLLNQDDGDDQEPPPAPKKPKDEAPKKPAPKDDDDDDDPPAKPAPKKPAPKDDDDDDDDDVPTKPAPKKEDKKAKDDDPTAEQLGLEVGNMVFYEGEECEITKISGDGTSLTLESEDEDTYRGVAPKDVKKVKVKDAKPAPAPKKPEPLDDDDDDDDDPPAKPKAGKKPAPKDDDDDDDD